MLPLMFDEDMDERIVRGVRRRLPGADTRTVAEAGIRGHDDDQVMSLAASEGRLLVSHDVTTMAAVLRRRIDRGEPSSGLLIVRQSLPVGKAVEDLELIVTATTPEDWVGRLEFLPL